jgi:hypothetical protein
MVDRLCTPQPIVTLIEKIELGTNHERIKRRTYIYATNWGFPPIDQIYDRIKGYPNWKVYEVDSGHDIMIDAPARLADILTEIG